MHRSPILFLIINIVAVAIMTSCASRTVEGYVKTEAINEKYSPVYFSNAATDYIYKSNISVYGHEFGGIVIIKKINDNTHRVAFTTEFGNKLFDFELTDTDFKVNYILEDLDRKIIVNTLKHDFILLLKKNHPIAEQYQNEDFTVYKSESNGRYNFLFLDKKKQNLVRLVNATKSKEKVIFTFLPAENDLAQNIIIDHQNIKLKIELNYINQ